MRQAESCERLQRAVEAVPVLAGQADNEVGGDVLEAGLLGEFDGINGLGGGMNPADTLEFGIGKGLDPEGESVEAEVFSRSEEFRGGGFGVDFKSGFNQL